LGILTNINHCSLQTEPFDDLLSYKGDLIIGLKFVPPDVTSAMQKKGKRSSRGSLNVLVKEAKNLTAVKANGTSDPFCKRYACQQFNFLLINQKYRCYRFCNFFKDTKNILEQFLYFYVEIKNVSKILINFLLHPSAKMLKHLLYLLQLSVHLQAITLLQLNDFL
jgi:hypothetical protein